MTKATWGERGLFHLTLPCICPPHREVGAGTEAEAYALTSLPSQFAQLAFPYSLEPPAQGEHHPQGAGPFHVNH